MNCALIKYKHHVMKKPDHRIVRHREGRQLPRSSMNDFVLTSLHNAGESVVLFTMFYCSMNWWYYKRLNDDIEKSKKKK